MITLILLAVLSSAALGEFTARLDRTQVVEGDPVVLTLTATGNGNGTPDYSVLQQDFDLLSQGQSNQFRMINGQTSSSREWHLTLMPKRSGEITIPAITFGNSTSRPVTLQVLAAAQADKQGVSRPVMLEAEIETERPYVQQQLIYTVRVLHALPLRDANLSEPRIENALVRPLGQERRFETYRNGRQFQAIERRYAVMPQRSGTLAIGGPVLTARVPEPGQQQGNSLRDRFFGRDPFAGLSSMLGQTRPIQVRAADSSVDVRAQPPGTAQPWLPAESLTLTEHWAPDPSSYRVGEPLTRTVTIRARGLSDEQLPEPDISTGIDANAYPDQPQAQTQADGDAVVAQKVIKSAIVPTKAGELRVPALEIAWWDVKSDQARIAQLPAQTIQIAAGTGVPMTAATEHDAVGAQPDRTSKTGSSNITADSATSRTAESRGIDAGSPTNWWPWLTLGFAIAWGVVSWLWWRERSRRHRVGPAPEASVGAEMRQQSPSSLRRQRTAIETACRDNDPRQARHALIAWAEARWPEQSPMRLDLVAALLGEQARATLDTLDSRLYGQADASWNGTEAWIQLKPLIESAETQARGEKPAEVALPPLYPSVP